MRISYLILNILLSVLLTTSAFAAEVSKKVDISLGTQLVKLSLSGTPYKGAAFGTPPESSKETFLIFHILGKYAGTLAWFAVNPWTGDVWNMDECKRLSNSALRKAQEDIKNQFRGKEIKEYERLHDLRPYHMYDLEPCP